MGTTYSLFDGSLATATIRTDGPFSLATEFATQAGYCFLLGFRFRRPDNIAQTVTGKLWDLASSDGSTGLEVASATFSLTANAGWKDVYLATPVRIGQISVQRRYRVAIRCTRFCETNNYFTSGTGSVNTTRGPMIMPNKTNARLQAQGSFNASDAYPGQAAATGQNWWADVLVADTDPRLGRSGSFVAMAGS